MGKNPNWVEIVDIPWDISLTHRLTAGSPAD